MNYTETYYLRKSGEFANARQESDLLPMPYGELDGIGSGGVWPCPCIDTVNFKYLVAACAIETTGLILYDKDGAVISAATYTVSTATGDTIADFASDQGDGLTARGKGKKVSGSVLTNPIDLVLDILDTAGFTAIDTTAQLLAKSIAASKNYKAAGILLADRRLDEIVTEILASFLGNAWMNQNGDLVVQLDDALTTYNIQGVLAERDFDGSETVSWSIENLVNQAEAYYAPTYIQVDQRFSEGARSDFLGYDDGAGTCDAASQMRYGVRRPVTPFEWRWIFDATTLHAVQARVVEVFAYPVYTLSCVELSYRNIQVDAGQFVTFSTEILRDENGLPLKNQIGKVLAKKTALMTPRIAWILQDTGVYLALPPMVFDGSWLFDGSLTFGGQRNRNNLA